ncbi:SusC/RagA family TonB-linked outer membrane protein [Pinibacter aurantiacus]|uniref:TonB-dependent receptor n=1 Tax=Pinibacter aurantiacus TaxID=2851599 RepID=A0A9E2S8F5_9BACT|nr:TonB-dependent receptor [Pinibacter aurantiacus]MBV4358221.1 TonB-dependent receptor [Pinibacter aurantiacus]
MKLLKIPFEKKETDQPVVCKNSATVLALKICKRYCIVPLLLVLGLLMNVPVLAQNARNITGSVMDDKGNALSAVSIIIKGSKNGASTDELGKFAINAKSSDVLVFTMTGYGTVEMQVNNHTTLSVRLTPSLSSLGEVVVVGYGTQKKLALTGAISTIKGSDIVATKNENVLNSLAGKVPGLRVVQNTGEPGDFNSSYDIRGMGQPLLVIDGVPRDDIARIDPNDIESFSILKDASAAIYGVRAANGVILITTKKGKKGFELNYSGTYGWQVPSRQPAKLSAAEWMTLYNEVYKHNIANIGKALPYDSATIANYANGTTPSTDWDDAVLRTSAPQTQHNISASGGNDKISYFASLGYTHQDGMFKSGDLFYNRYNMRSNVSAKLSSNLTFDFNLSAIMDQKDMPSGDNGTWWVYRDLWYQTPLQQAYANGNPDYPSTTIQDPLNPIVHSTSKFAGYQKLNNKWFQSSVALTYNIPQVKGLSIKGMFSYDYNTNNNKIYQKSYKLYRYDAATQAYITTSTQRTSLLQRYFYQKPQSLSQLSLNYANSFKRHSVTAFLAFENTTRTGDNFGAQRNISLPVDQLFAGDDNDQQKALMSSDASVMYKYIYSSVIGRLAYNYNQKYFAQFSFREDGSSRFGTGKQWGFFPSMEAGWRISEEGFWKNTDILAQNINNVKLRASYGITGDDNTANPYQFLSGYDYPSGGAVFGGQYVAAVSNKGIPNPNFTWYTAKTFDLGIDVEAWKGLVNFSFDYFERNRTGLPSTQTNTLSEVVGVNLPQQNLNGDRTRGFDFEIGHKNHIGQLGYNVRATFGYARTMKTNVNAARAGNSYLNWVNNQSNRYNDIYTGYGSNGQFQSWEDIQNSPVFVSTATGTGTLPGDYIYEDWNGDGQINSGDSHPIATQGMPLITYGVTLGGSYKGFDLSMVFQGAARVNAAYTEQLAQPLWANAGGLEQFMSRWHPADPNANPYDPSTKWVSGYYAYTGTVPFVNTMSNLHSAAYCRLKSMEIGYTISPKLLERIGIKNIRAFVSGYNLLTITPLKYIDPERPSNVGATGATASNYGYMYPVDKMYTLGLNVKF